MKWILPAVISPLILSGPAVSRVESHETLDLIVQSGMIQDALNTPELRASSCLLHHYVYPTYQSSCSTDPTAPSTIIVSVVLR